jgi:DNA-binding CsgD family transcriptional regulator
VVFNPSSLIEVSRRLAEAQSADDYLRLAADQLRLLLHAEDVLWIDTDFLDQRFVVWRASIGAHDQTAERVMPELHEHPAIQSYLECPNDLAPRRLTDLSSFSHPGHKLALGLSREVMGQQQLSMVIDIDPAGRGRGWIVTRRGSDFSDDDLATASSLLSLLIAFDHLYRKRPDRRRELTAAGAPRTGRGTCLSAREQQVVDLLARGLTAHAIGTALGISPRTVGKHLEHIYTKIGHHDRLMAALYASNAALQIEPVLS